MNASIARIYIITNLKGGVTKTTTSVSLAHWFASQGYKVLLIDFDPQGQSATALGLDPAPGIFDLFVAEKPVESCMIGTGRDNLTLIPGNQKTKTATLAVTSQLSTGDMNRGQLLDYLRAVGRGYDYMVIDTPSAGIFQEIALEAADTILIPAACDYLSIDGVKNTIATVEKLGAGTTRRLIVPAMYNATNNESRQNLQLLTDSYGEAVASPVPASTAVREAVAYGKTIWEYRSRNETLSRVRDAYVMLGARLLGSAQ